MEQNNTLVNPEALKAVNTQLRLDAYNSSVNYNTQLANNEHELKKLGEQQNHEKEMSELKFTHEKKAAGWLSWMGWKTSSLATITSTTLIILASMIITTGILACKGQNEYFQPFWDKIFHLLDIVFGFVVGNKVTSIKQSQKNNEEEN